MTDTSTATTDIAAFAAAVRARLSDLPVDEVADLTDGLEADLLDQANDGDERLTLDDPIGYADELRASAGLPAYAPGADPEASPSPRPGIWESAAARFRSDLAALRATRLGGWTVDFLLALRPVWWVFRGWVVYQFVAATFAGVGSVVPPHFGLFLVLLACVVLSVQWGRGRWAPNRFVQVVRLLVTIGVLCATIPLLFWVAQESAPSTDEASAYGVSDPAMYGWTGLSLDGKPVTNVFGFDAAGEKVEGLRLFDQNGNPLVLVGPGNVGSESTMNLDLDLGSSSWAQVPSDTSAPGGGWNVFPLEQARILDDGTVSSIHRATPFPFEKIAAAPGYSAPTPTPTP